MCAEEAGTFFVATAERFLDPATGRPAAELFQDDRLHLSPAGYAVWAEAIAAALAEVLAEAGTPASR
jgi:lysophospholipase L1-like esterase